MKVILLKTYEVKDGKWVDLTMELEVPFMIRAEQKIELFDGDVFDVEHTAWSIKRQAMIPQLGKRIRTRARLVRCA